MTDDVDEIAVAGGGGDLEVETEIEGDGVAAFLQAFPQGVERLTQGPNDQIARDYRSRSTTPQGKSRGNIGRGRRRYGS